MSAAISRVSLATALCVLASAAVALECRTERFEGAGYAVCRVDFRRDDLRLWQDREDGSPWATFAAVEGSLRAEGGKLGFAMNGGMYHPNRRPVGYTVIGGETIRQLVTIDGPGNFGLLPNGVLCWGGGSGRIMETLSFASARPSCEYASQSGPMLVIGGDLHPKFLVDSDSRYVRNGVGVTEDGAEAVFAISGRAVTFHEFARFFRDRLGTPDALYLDGNVSRLHAPEIGRTDTGRPLGPIVGVVVPF